jgi:glycosyltransferase involved in cell wall biosynthesis
MNRGNAKGRFCLVGPSYPYRGGISHYTTRLIGELAARHEVLAVNFKRLYPGFLFPGKTQLDESARPIEARSLRLIDSMNPFTWISAGARIARWKPDAVVVQWWHPFFAPAMFVLCLVLKLVRRGRIVFICHNVLPHEGSLVDGMLARLAFALPDAFLVQSLEDRDKLFKIRPDAGVVVQPLPLFDFFKTGLITKAEARARIGAGEGPLILFFGLVRPYKGLRHLIEAMPQVRVRVSARLLVVGEFYEDRAPYDRLVESLGLGESVRFVDRYVPNEEVEPYFVASDLVVLPYVSATQSAIVQVAISFDRPVIVTEVGGLPEVVASGRTGFVVPAKDPRTLAEAIIKFFEEDWGARMAPFFEEEKARFSWEAVVRSIENLVPRARAH